MTATRPPKDPLPRDWGKIFVRVARTVDDGRLGLVAAGVTFYAILALFPALTALVSVYGLVTDPRSIAEQVMALYGVLPEDVIGMIRDQLNSLTQAERGKLGLGFAVSLAAAMWSVNNAMKAVFDGLNMTYGEPETRGFLELNGVSFLFALGAVVMVMAYMTAIAIVPLVLEFVGLGGFAAGLIQLLRWPTLVLMSLFALALLHRYGTCGGTDKWRVLTLGNVFVLVAWVVMSVGFSYYLSNFAHYDKTYGALGTVIGVMVWMWLSTYILLVGAALNAQLERDPR